METQFLDSITYFETSIQQELDRATDDTAYEVEIEEETTEDPECSES